MSNLKRTGVTLTDEKGNNTVCKLNFEEEMVTISQGNVTIVLSFDVISELEDIIFEEI